MTIKRDDIDRRIVDFSEVTSGRRLPLVHPGEILRDEFLIPMGISVYELAKALKVPRSRTNDIVLGRRAITADTAMRLGALLRHVARILDQSAGALRSRRCQPHSEEKNRAGGRAPKRSLMGQMGIWM